MQDGGEWWRRREELRAKPRNQRVSRKELWSLAGRKSSGGGKE